MKLYLRLTPVCLLSMTLASCQSDSSVVIDEKNRGSALVENGTAYDRATCNLGTTKKIVLPHDAVVKKGGEEGKLQFLMTKRLSFAGHPAVAMSIRTSRNMMGCQTRIENDVLQVSTFGEWDSRKEGGALMKLVVVVHDGIEVELRKGLSGPDRDSVSTEGWTKVPAIPNQDRTSEK